MSGNVALWPLDAHAQKIPWILVPLAAFPLVALVLSATLGILAKSWSVGLGNTALVIVWLAWFVAASNYTTHDLPIWSSIVALGLHSLAMVWFIVLRIVRRVRVRDEA